MRTTKLEAFNVRRPDRAPPLPARTQTDGSRPVTTIEDFRTLDEGEILEGYLDGVHGNPPGRLDCSRSYWHGWRNGMIERGALPVDEATLSLRRAFERLR